MLELNIQLRSQKGKNVRQLRKKDLIPGIVYGPGIGSLPVQVSYRVFEKVYEEAGPGTLVNLKVEEGNGAKSDHAEDMTVLIHEAVRDVLSRKFIHIDFYKVRLDKLIRIAIPLEFEGEASVTAESGGIIVKNMHEVEIEGLPLKLPREVLVDISCLKTFDDQILVKDIKLSEGITLVGDPEGVVVSVEAPRAPEEFEEAPEEKVEEIEVVRKEKRGEEEGEEGPEQEKS